MDRKNPLEYTTNFHQRWFSFSNTREKIVRLFFYNSTSHNSPIAKLFPVQQIYFLQKNSICPARYSRKFQRIIVAIRHSSITQRHAQRVNRCYKQHETQPRKRSRFEIDRGQFPIIRYRVDPAIAAVWTGTGVPKVNEGILRGAAISR